MKVNFKNIVVKALLGDVPAARIVSDICRHMYGMNYAETLAQVRKIAVERSVAEPTDAEWNALMYECDAEDSSQ